MKKLPLVEPRHELSGKFPPRFEQAVRSATTGDDKHRGLLFSSVTIARWALRQCMPPSAAEQAVARLDQARRWAARDTSLRELKVARAALFEGIPNYQRATLNVLGVAQLASSEPLEQHVAGVVRRYVGLAVAHSVGSALHCLDGIVDPLELLGVVKEASAALAYRNVGLGPARTQELLENAKHAARWEVESSAAVDSHSSEQLTLQLVHEYLGVHWKNHVDAQRLYLEQFLSWACAEP